MANIDLSKYGITGVTEIVHNPSYEMLFEEETKAGLEGYEVGKETELGTVNVMTGIYTGRSPKDKYIVMDENSKDTVWWNSQEYPNDNHPMSEETWAAGMEQEMKRYYVTNVDTEVTVFQKTQKIAVINNSGKECQTDLYINGDFIVRLTLEPGEMRWLNETM